MKGSKLEAFKEMCKFLENMLPHLTRASRGIVTAKAVATVPVVLVLVASCTASRTDDNTEATDRGLPSPVTAEPVAPGHCRIVGTIVEVQGPDRGAASGEPCSKFPCSATVLVDSVLGYGSAFPGALAARQVIEVRFQYTLAPSREAFPKETFSLPGLSPGQRFRADVSGFEEMLAPGERGPRVRFGVAMYSVL